MVVMSSRVIFFLSLSGWATYHFCKRSLPCRLNSSINCICNVLHRIDTVTFVVAKYILECNTIGRASNVKVYRALFMILGIYKRGVKQTELSYIIFKHTSHDLKNEDPHPTNQILIYYFILIHDYVTIIQLLYLGSLWIVAKGKGNKKNCFEFRFCGSDGDAHHWSDSDNWQHTIWQPCFA